MSWLFSQALVAEYSAASCSDGERYALSSKTPTQQAYLHSDRMTVFSSLSRFGMTFEPLTESLGEELLTWFLAGFRARTSVSQGGVMGSTESAVASGQKWRGSLARYDLNSCTWKTAQHSLLAGSDVYSETWPRWGTTVAGALYLLPLPAHLTLESESGLLPTPTVAMVKGSSLGALTRQSGRSRKRDRLDYFIEGDAKLGRLNPTWVEWVMGWPLGWTELQPSATDKYLSVTPLRGAA